MKCLKQWKQKGIKTRDWVKTKVVFFDEDRKPNVLPIAEYRAMIRDKEKANLAAMIEQNDPSN